jgi:hypothetical protein
MYFLIVSIDSITVSSSTACIFGVDVGGDVKILEEIVEDARREIVDKAVLIIPSFIDIANSLGLDMDHVNGLAGLAGMLV